MKESKGFLLIETAAVFLLAGILLLAAVRLYGSCIRLQQRSNKLSQAWQMGQQAFFLGTVSAGWRIAETEEFHDGLHVRKLQVQDEQGEIWCSLVCIEK